jgi:twitching motility protein PilT
LVTGPTGSGKTTTLAAMINHINENYNKHIITIEDPIEYIHTHKKSIIEHKEI